MDSVFWGGKHSGKISPKSLCTYLHCDYLTYSISNNTHTHTACCFFHILLQSSKKRPTSGSVQIEEMTDQTSNAAFMLTGQFFEKYVKILKIYTNHNLFIRRKVVPGRRVTLTAESTLSSVCMTKTFPRLTEFTAGQARRQGRGCACRPPGATEKVRLMGS